MYITFSSKILKLESKSHFYITDSVLIPCKKLRYIPNEHVFDTNKDEPQNISPRTAPSTRITYTFVHIRPADFV